MHTLRNLAFYKSWYKAGKPGEKKQFWINANSNFLDIAILEWCKLFADRRGRHYYARVIDDPPQFMTDMLAKLAMTEGEFTAYVEELKNYRDKFIAHLDELEGYVVPKIKVARESSRFLYDRLQDQEQQANTFAGAPESGSEFYDHFFDEGLHSYKKLI